MIKKRIRCYKRFVTDCKGQIIPIYFSLADFYEGFDFYICKNCKELFFIDLEELKYSPKLIEEIINFKKCPTCNNALKEFILKYPLNYYSNISNCWCKNENQNNIFPPDEESLLLEMFDLSTE